MMVLKRWSFKILVHTIHLEWQRQNKQKKTWQYQGLARTWSSWGSCMLLVGIQNGTATMEKLAITYKVKHSFTIWPGKSTPIYLSEIKTYGNTKTYFCVTITQNRKYWKYPSTREWVNRQWKGTKLLIYTTQMNLTYIMPNKEGSGNSSVLLSSHNNREKAKPGVEHRWVGDSLTTVE